MRRSRKRDFIIKNTIAECQYREKERSIDGRMTTQRRWNVKPIPFNEKSQISFVSFSILESKNFYFLATSRETEYGMCIDEQGLYDDTVGLLEIYLDVKSESYKFCLNLEVWNVYDNMYRIGYRGSGGISEYSFTHNKR